MTTAAQYKAIETWHRLSGSRAYYITDLQHKAAANNAPLDALYVQHDRDNKPVKWICVSDLAADHPFRLMWESLPK